MMWKLLLTGVGTLGLALPALADWDPGDPYKMHYPQMPDPNGWDVWFNSPQAIGDDWRCSQTGPVTDIHFWFSSIGDMPFQMQTVRVMIFNDVPAGPDSYSHPEIAYPAWQRVFAGADVQTRLVSDQGDQGWYEPHKPSVDPTNPNYQEHDHHKYWQANIENITNPFQQTEGETYWLVLNVEATDQDQQVPAWLGWKTSLQHFEDDAVFWYYDQPSGGSGEWRELVDPVTGKSLDMAFVITPETGNYALVAGLGLVAFAASRRFRAR